MEGTTSSQPVQILDEVGFEEAIQSALRQEHDSRAWEIAKQGAEIFPESEPLTRAAEVLAPARVVKKKRKASHIKGLTASLQWLAENGSRYKDRWIAVHDGQMVADAATRDELDKHLSSKIRENALITRIP